jgi:RHS repeat-associated protein
MAKINIVTQGVDQAISQATGDANQRISFSAETQQQAVGYFRRFQFLDLPTKAAPGFSWPRLIVEIADKRIWFLWVGKELRCSEAEGPVQPTQAEEWLREFIETNLPLSGSDADQSGLPGQPPAFIAADKADEPGRSRFPFFTLLIIAIIALGFYSDWNLETFKDRVASQLVSVSPAYKVNSARIPLEMVEVAVEPWTGALKIDTVDLAFPGHPLGLGLKRVYRGRPDIAGGLGNGWYHSFDYRLIPFEGGVALFCPGGISHLFQETGKGVYLRRGVTDVIAKDGIGFAWQSNLGIMYFNEKGQAVLLRAAGTSIKFSYSGSRLSKIEGDFGQWLELIWSEEGYLAAAKSSLGEKVEYGYSTDGSLKAAVRNGVLVCRYGYDSKKCLKLVEINSGFAWKIDNDDSGRVTSLTRPGGYAQKFAYGEKDGFTIFSVIEPGGGTTEWRTNTDGDRIEIVDAVGRREIIRDPVTGQIKSARDRRGNITTYSWDKSLRLSKITHADGSAIKIDYAGNLENPAKVIDAAGNATEYKYDEAGRVTAIKSGDNRETFSYDKSGRLTGWQVKDGSSRQFQYGNGWEPIKVIADGQTLLEVKATKEGRPESVKTPYGNMAWADFRKGMETNLAERFGTLDFSRAGNIWNSPAGMKIKYDADAQPVEIVFPDSSKMQIGRDAAGRAIRVQHPDGFAEEFAWDGESNLISRKFPDGKKTEYAYDALNRPVSIREASGSETKLEYDAAGNMLSVTKPGFKKSFQLNGAGISAIDLVFADKINKQIGYKIGRDRQATLSFDKFEQSIKVDAKNGDTTLAGPAGKFTLRKNIAQKAFEIVFPNGVVETLETQKKTGSSKIKIARKNDVLIDMQIIETSDGLERKSLISREVPAPIGGATRNEKSVFDKTGRLLSSEAGGAAYKYNWDAMCNRVSEEISGKLVESRFGNGGLLLERDGRQYRWSDRGTLVAIVAKDGETSFSFDDFDRLISIRAADGREVNYSYDENGLLVSRRSGKQTTYYVWDGANLLAECDESGKVTRWYVQGPGIDRILAIVEDDQVHYLHRDENGSIILATDKSGKPVGAWTYDPFGNLVARCGDWQSPVLFCGLIYEPLFDLYYMRSRFYDPKTGSFLSRDPAPLAPENPEEAHPYLYARGNPLLFKDPSGAFPLLNMSGAANNMAKSLGGSSTSEDGNYIAETGVYIARDTFLGVSSGIFEKFTKEVWVADGDMYFRKLGKVNLPGGGTTVVRGGLGRCVDVKKTVIPARGMELLSKVAGHAASIFGIGYDLSTMKSQYESGEVSYEEHKTGVFAKVIVGGGSVAVGALVGTLGLSTMPLVAATAAVGVVGSEIEKVARGGAAVTEAEQAVKAWKDNDSRLAWDKIRQAKIALADGNWKEAQRLSRDMRKFIGSRKGENPGMPTMVEITALSSEISDTIKAERIKKEQEGEKKRAAAQKYNDDLRRKVEEWKEKERAAAAKNTDTKPPVPGNKQAIEVKQQPQTQVESKPHKIDLTTPHAAIRVMCGTTPATIRVYGGRNIRIVEEEIIGYGITREKRITVDCDFGPGHAKWALDVENDTPMHVGVHTRHTLLNKRADDRSGIRVHVEGTTEKTGLVGQGAELTVPGGGFFWTKIRLGLKYVP